MSNSIDARITQDLVTTLTDGADGFRLAAEKVEHEPLAVLFRDFAMQRELFAERLITIAAYYGDEMHDDGSTLARLHRTWMSLKEAVTDADPATLLQTCLTGEEHAVAAYEDALGRTISEDLRTVVHQQLAEIRQTQAALASHLVTV